MFSSSSTSDYVDKITFWVETASDISAVVIFLRPKVENLHKRNSEFALFVREKVEEIKIYEC